MRTPVIHFAVVPGIWMLCFLAAMMSHDTKGLSFHFASLSGIWVPMSTPAAGNWLVNRLAGGLLLMMILATALYLLRLPLKIYFALLPFLAFSIWIAIHALRTTSTSWLLAHEVGDICLPVSFGIQITAVLSIIAGGILRIIQKMKGSNKAIECTRPPGAATHG